MTQQQSETVKNEVNAVVQEGSSLVRLLEEPMWQAIFASVTTVGLFGVVLSGIWMMDAIVN